MFFFVSEVLEIMKNAYLASSKLLNLQLILQSSLTKILLRSKSSPIPFNLPTSKSSPSKPLLIKAPLIVVQTSPRVLSVKYLLQTSTVLQKSASKNSTNPCCLNSFIPKRNSGVYIIFNFSWYELKRINPDLDIQLSSPFNLTSFSFKSSITTSCLNGLRGALFFSLDYFSASIKLS